LKRFSRALVLSDIHLGWVPAAQGHARLIEHLPRAAGDAELIVLNGDVIDDHRGQPGSLVRDLIARFSEIIARFKREGREVVYVEGNHDAMHLAKGELIPDRWHYDFEGKHGERVRVLHGHRFEEKWGRAGAYEHYGRRFLRFENWSYSKVRALRSMYPHTIGWMVGAIGWLEDRFWRPRFYDRARVMLGLDVLVHGHFHFGPGRLSLGALQLHKSGSWVSRGHRGTVDRMLRYRDGKFERIALHGDRWIAPDDGR
jgi:UDP-2,3-diacylglucosamine pyrophosphatase LpxH